MLVKTKSLTYLKSLEKLRLTPGINRQQVRKFSGSKDAYSDRNLILHVKAKSLTYLEIFIDASLNSKTRQNSRDYSISTNKSINMGKIYFIAFLICSCGSSGAIEIINIKRDSSVNISTNAAYPTNLRLHVTGHTNDTFLIKGRPVPGGAVDTILDFVWYNKIIHLDYQSYRATKGRLNIRYEL